MTSADEHPDPADRARGKARARHSGSSAHLLTIKASAATTGGRLAVIENLASRGPASPLHVHRNEDEWFYVIEGELNFWVGGSVIVAPTGTFGVRPARILAHVQCHVLSGAVPARHGAGRLRGLRAGRSGCRLRRSTLPPPPDGPPDFARLTALAAECGIEILGPPGLPE